MNLCNFLTCGSDSKVTQNNGNCEEKSANFSNFSWQTKALIIGAVAIAAIATIAAIVFIGITFPPFINFILLPAVGKEAIVHLFIAVILAVEVASVLIPLTGLTFGSIVYAIAKYKEEIVKQDFLFAKNQTDPNIKLSLLDKAAAKNCIEAMQEMYIMGKDLILKALHEKDEENLQKGLAAIEKSAEYLSNRDIQKYLSSNPHIREDLKKKINIAIENSNFQNFEDSIELYWRILKDVRNFC